jgi:hypothetical protein
VTEDQHLANVLRKFLGGTNGVWTDFGHHLEVPFLQLDGTVELTEFELQAVVAAEGGS